jgi:hypothetical protein
MHANADHLNIQNARRYLTGICGPQFKFDHHSLQGLKTVNPKQWVKRQMNGSDGKTLSKMTFV